MTRRRGSGCGLLAAVAALCAGVPARGDVSTVSALAGGGALEPAPGWMLLDDLDMDRFPSAVLSHPTGVHLELGTFSGAWNDDGWGRITARRSGGRTLAAMLAVRRPSPRSTRTLFDNAGWSPPGFPRAERSDLRSVDRPDPRLAFGAGVRVGSGLDLAVAGSFEWIVARTASESDASAESGVESSVRSETQRASSAYTLSIGAGHRGSERIRLLEAALHLTNRAFDNLDWSTQSSRYSDFGSATDRSVQKRSTRGLGVGLATRTAFATGEKTWAMVGIGFEAGGLDYAYTERQSSGSTGAEPVTTDDFRSDVRNSLLRAGSGVALHVQPNERAEGFAGVEFITEATARSGDQTVVNAAAIDPTTDAYSAALSERAYLLPVTAGVTVRPAGPWVLRFGLSKSLTNWTDTVVSTGRTIENPSSTGSTRARATTFPSDPVRLSFGWGLGAADLRLDGVVRVDLLFATVYALSGVPGSLSARVSLTYLFDATPSDSEDSTAPTGGAESSPGGTR